MDDHSDQTRKPRADAVRNRERVLEAAKAVFNAGGPEASLEAVAASSPQHGRVMSASSTSSRASSHAPRSRP